MLAELGVAEAALGGPEAAEHLAAAAEAMDDPVRRAELALRRGRALDTGGLHAQACAAYDDGLGGAARRPRRLLRARAARPATDRVRRHRRDRSGAAGTRGRALGARARPAGQRPETQGQRLLLAQTATYAAATGQPAKVVEQLAARAWDDGRLLEQADPQWIGWRMVASVFVLSGALERSLEITDAALEDARRRGWPLGFATVSYVRGLPQLWQGRVGAALADLEHARDARRYGWHEFSRSAAAHYALCLIERGELQRAEQVLSEDGPLDGSRDLEDALRMYSMAELRLSQGSPSEALELALAVGSIAEQGIEFFGYCSWRATAAQAALALGDTERALGMAREAHDRWERTGILHERIRALRVNGLCEGGEQGIERLRAAAELGATAPPRLETIRALVEFGAALRRANRRSDARVPLQQAADMAREGGALALYERARTELAATGARPRREVLLSGPASLTPSERRIAELAAGGQSNREIAQALFVTPKTVEYHLRNSYRKLDIAGRGELAEALGR